MHSCRISIGDDKVRYVPNYDRSCSDYRMFPDRDSIRNACTDSNSRALADMHFPAHRTPGGDAGEVLQRAFMINQSSRINYAEFSDMRLRSNMSLSENRCASSDLGRGGDYRRWMSYDREFQAGHLVHQLEIDRSARPIVSDGDHQMLQHLLLTDSSDVCEIAQYSVVPLFCTGWQRVVQIAGYAVFPCELDRVKEDRCMP